MIGVSSISGGNNKMNSPQDEAKLREEFESLLPTLPKHNFDKLYNGRYEVDAIENMFQGYKLGLFRRYHVL